MIDWYALRFRLHFWLMQSWTMHCAARLLSKQVPEKDGFGKFRESKMRAKSGHHQPITLPSDPAEDWWQQEIKLLYATALRQRVAELRRVQDEQYSRVLVSVCVATVLLAFAMALCAMFA